MPKKKKTEEETPQQDGALVKAAKAIGEAAGKVATAIGAATPAPKPVGKLPKKNKARLPRKQKKAAKKASQPRA